MQSTIKRNAFTLGLACILSLSLMGLLPAIASAAAVATKTVTYLPGATDTTGAVPVDPTAYSWFDPVTLMSPGTLARPGYTFAGWKVEHEVKAASFNVFPVVSEPPVEVTALGADKEAEFMADYATWVELYAIDTSAASVVELPLIVRLPVTPNIHSQIGTCNLPPLPSGDYVMLIWRPGFMARWQIVTIDAIEGTLTETFSWASHFAVFQITNGHYSALHGGDAVIDITDAYCLIAGDINNDYYINAPDISRMEVIVQWGIAQSGGIPPANGKFASWVTDRAAPVMDPSFATFDFNGNGYVDQDDVDLLQHSFAGNIFPDNLSGYFLSGLFLYDVGLLSPIATLGRPLAAFFWGPLMSLSGVKSGIAVNDSLGWENQVGQIYQPGATITLPGDVILVAQWTPVDVPPKPPGPGGNGEKPGPGIPAAGDGASLIVALLSACAGVSAMLSAGWPGLSRRRRCKR